MYVVHCTMYILDLKKIIYDALKIFWTVLALPKSLNVTPPPPPNR